MAVSNITHMKPAPLLQETNAPIMVLETLEMGTFHTAALEADSEATDPIMAVANPVGPTMEIIGPTMEIVGPIMAIVGLLLAIIGQHLEVINPSEDQMEIMDRPLWMTS